MAPFDIPHPLKLHLMGNFDMWKKKKTKHSENNSYHLINKLKLPLYRKRFSCICSHFWENSQTNDERTKFLMKTARAPPNRRIKVCENSKNWLQLQKHLKSSKIYSFIQKNISNHTNCLTYHILRVSSH